MPKIAMVYPSRVKETTGEELLYSPLALVILGGLVSSTLLTRVVTPVLYTLLPPEIEPEAATASAPAPAGAAPAAAGAG